MNSENTAPKKRVFSALQPSGMLTLGNYLGAVRNMVALQDEYDCIYAVADLHAITVRQVPAELRRRSLETYALLMASGIDKDKSIFFIQSHVPAHSELAWLLNCYAQFGEFSRMTQFKDKAKTHADNVNVGLFSYPALMAADILLYNTDFVPVGEDQKQHLEITRTIAERFNNAYSPTFVVPQAMIPKVGARIKSLQDPSKKMSKSDENVNGYIAMLDEPDVILRKLRRAVTDSEARVAYGEGKDGVNNLMGIYSAVTGKGMEAIEAEFEGKGYGEFKEAVGEAVVEALRPVQERFRDLMNNKDYLAACYREGAQRASRLAERMLQKARKKIGFLLD